MPVLRELSPEVPTLGVCLGLEAAVYEYGGSVGHAPEPIHGKAFPIDCVQFHPESVLTGVGHDVIENFLVEFVA
jgi:anthranilate/para-aminobenzoate synthase component II